MITTEQEARAAVAKVGPDAYKVASVISERMFMGTFCPGSARIAADIYEAQGKPRKASQLHRIATEWAAARGGAK